MQRGTFKFGSLLIVAMHGLLSFESDKNAFVAIVTFGVSVPLAVLKNRSDGG